MKSHPECELLYATWALQPLLKLLIFHYHIMSSLYLSSPIYFLYSMLLIVLHFAGGPCSGSCGHSIQCKTIFHPLQFSLLIDFQLYRSLLCILLLVCLILPFLLYCFLLLYKQPFLSVFNIPSGLPSKAPIPRIVSPMPGNFILRPSMHRLIKN